MAVTMNVDGQDVDVDVDALLERLATSDAVYMRRGAQGDFALSAGELAVVRAGLEIMQTKQPERQSPEQP